MLVRCIDIETIGLAPPDTGSGVCEIGWADLRQEAGRWRVADGGSMLVNPGCPIPPEASAVHHIVDEDVANAISFEEALPLVLSAGIVLAAHNARFERAWITDDLTGGLAWVCSYKSALRLWPEVGSHSNQALRYARRPEGLDRDLASLAHRARPDAYVSAHHLRDLLAVASLDELIRISAEPALLVRCGFGKHRGTRWADVPLDYLRWAERQDFDEDVAFTVRHHLQRARKAA